MTKRLATIDFETDPFETGATIKPFCVGVYHDDGTYWDYWGDDCAEQLVGYLKSRENATTYYAHNGGNFDFYFLLPWISGDVSLINGRIVKCHIGNAELRDSYAIFPDPLSAYRKDELTEEDYKIKFRRENREQYKNFILKYLRNDCVYLYEAVTRFHQLFGDHLTIGGCAMRELKKDHDFEAGNEHFHKKFSPFYFGGRTQCFATGVIIASLSMFDINSQYLSVMKGFNHPLGITFDVGNTLQKNTFFVEVEGKNRGCLPIRTRTGIDFTSEYGIYRCGIYELQAGLETGTFEITKIHAAYNFHKYGTLAKFVDRFSDLKIDAKRRGVALDYLLFKRVGNSGYGKFAQDPENYADYVVTHQGEKPDEPGYTLSKTNGEYYIWERPARHKTYFNIATGASITSAARSILLRGLSSVERPIYVDTDSILCEGNSSLPLSPDILGHWKHEGDFDRVAIAGKKLYACFKDDVCEKKAHKGAKLTGEEILRIAQGETIEYASPAPKFKLDGSVGYVKRRIKATAAI